MFPVSSGPARGVVERRYRKVFSDTVKGEFDAKMEVYPDGSAMDGEGWREDQAGGGSVLSVDEEARHHSDDLPIRRMDAG